MSKELISKDTVFFVFQFDNETFNNLEYYKAEVERLNQVIEQMKINYSSIIDKGKYIESLEAFRRIFIVQPCLIGYKNLKIERLTIIQCSLNIKEGRCKISEVCKPRSELLKRIMP